MTNYIKHSLLGTRKVISSRIIRNFFVTRNKQPMGIGTNRMCISRDENCVNTMCFPRQLSTTARKLFTTICFHMVIPIRIADAGVIKSTWLHSDQCHTRFTSKALSLNYES